VTVPDWLLDERSPSHWSIITSHVWTHTTHTMAVAEYRDLPVLPTDGGDGREKTSTTCVCSRPVTVATE